MKENVKHIGRYIVKEYVRCEIEIVSVSEDIVTLSGITLPEDGNFSDVGGF